MVISEKIFGYLAAVVICLLLVVAGCAPGDKTKGKPERLTKGVPGGEVVTLALKFKPGDSTTYRLTTEKWRSVKFEGSVPRDTASRGGRSGEKVEMTFTQHVRNVDDEGNAVAKITIKELKYLGEEKDKVFLNFDSSGEGNRRGPLARLIGQSYTVEIAPSGQVENVTDAIEVQRKVTGATSVHRRASALVDPDAIRNRHAVPAIPRQGRNQLRTGDDWSRIKTVSFGMMGMKSYERIYALKEVKSEGGNRVAVVEMNAIPTSETAEELYEEQPTSTFAKMFDNIETYTGQLKVDLTAGRVEKYTEKLESEWIVVEPSGRGQDSRVPNTLKMTASRVYDLERID